MSDFLKYWDTRIDANERFFNNYPHIANFAFSECQKLWDRMEEKNKALLARHTALVEAVAWERECEELHGIITELYCNVAESAPEEDEISMTYFAARAEVDRLLNDAADCKEEG